MVMISFHANGKAPCEEDLLTIPSLEETDMCWQVRGLPWWLSGKESTCQCRRCRRHGFYPWVRKFPWRRKWQSVLVFLLENSMDSGAWQATVHGAEKSRIWLSICIWTIDQKLIAKGQKNSRSRSHSKRRRILDTEVQRCEIMYPNNQQTMTGLCLRLVQWPGGQTQAASSFCTTCELRIIFTFVCGWKQ